MRDGLKMAMGAGLTALLAWSIHGPLGQGEAFLQELQHRTQAALDARGLGVVKVAYATGPQSRRLLLSGDADPVQQGDALAVARSLGGGAAWSERREGVAIGAAEQAVAAADKGAPSNVVAMAATPVGAPPKRPLAPLPKPVVPSAPVPAAQCQEAVDRAVAGRVMSFQPGSAWLNATSLKIVKDVAATLKQCRSYKVEIAGHTDNSGDAGINRLMSEERAKRVRDALVEKGLSATAISAKGYGSSRPVGANPADPANRRITFTVSEGA